MAVCPACGSQIADNSAFCGVCGMQFSQGQNQGSGSMPAFYPPADPNYAQQAQGYNPAPPQGQGYGYAQGYNQAYGQSGQAYYPTYGQSSQMNQQGYGQGYNPAYGQTGQGYDPAYGQAQQAPAQTYTRTRRSSGRTAEHSIPASGQAGAQPVQTSSQGYGQSSQAYPAQQRHSRTQGGYAQQSQGFQPPAAPQFTPPQQTFQPPAAPQFTPPQQTFQPPAAPQFTPPQQTFQPPAAPKFTPPAQTFMPPGASGACAYHPGEIAVTTCARCGKPLCQDCLDSYGVSDGEYKGKALCYDCTKELVAENVEILKKNKKSIKLTFILTLVGMFIGGMFGIAFGGLGIFLGAMIGGCFWTFLKSWAGGIKGAVQNGGLSGFSIATGVLVGFVVSAGMAIYRTIRKIIDCIVYLRRTSGFIESDSAALRQMDDYMEFTMVRNQNRGVDIETLLRENSQLANNSVAQMARTQTEEQIEASMRSCVATINENGEIIRDFAA